MGQTVINKDGQRVVLPFEQITGKELKEYTGVDPDRIVTVTENGLTRQINDNERVHLQPDAVVSDAPRFVYGASERVEVVLAEHDHRALTSHLLRQSDPREQHAFLFARLCESPRGRRLIVKEMALAGPKDYIHQTPTYIELAPTYYLAATDKCEAQGLHIIECHSHPFAKEGVTFSSLDIENEREKFAWYTQKWPQMHASTLVFGHNSVDGHWFDTDESAIRPLAGVRVVGAPLVFRTATSFIQASEVDLLEDRFNRQELAFGELGQRRIRRTRVGIVGCGGLGSVFCLQLAHLGVEDFVLIDPDQVEATNLNRLVFAGPDDAMLNRHKVDVMADGIRSIRPNARVEAVLGSIADAAVQDCVKDVDVLIAGTDCDGARLICNDLAVRYLLPLIDTGTGLNVRNGRIEEAGGQMLLTLPGQFCLQCPGFIDPDKARVGLMNSTERARHVARGYGSGVSQPSVLFLNAALVSLAVGEFIKLVTGYAKPQSMIMYDALKPSVQALLTPSRDPGCPVCHPSALYAYGDEVTTTMFNLPVPAADLTSPEEAILVS